jgi:hypothetical protein
MLLSLNTFCVYVSNIHEILRESAWSWFRWKHLISIKTISYAKASNDLFLRKVSYLSLVSVQPSMPSRLHCRQKFDGTSQPRSVHSACLLGFNSAQGSKAISKQWNARSRGNARITFWWWSARRIVWVPTVTETMWQRALWAILNSAKHERHNAGLFIYLATLSVDALNGGISE